MKRLQILTLALLVVLMVGCGGEAPEPTVPAPTPDLAATVQAEVQKAMAEQPTQTPLPTYTPAPTYTAPPEPPTEEPVPTAVLTEEPPLEPTKVEVVPTVAPTEEPPPPKPTATQPPLPPGKMPEGEWTVRSYNTDDAGLVFVNGVMVGGSLYKQDSDWININDYLLPIQQNVVAFASYNGASGGDWGFAIRRDDVAVWGSEGTINDDWTLSYVQQVAILGDGSVEAMEPDVSARMPPAGVWYVRARSLQDLGGILVNGQPVAVNWSNHGSDWVEITGLLYSDRDNELTFATWNFDGVYSWDFAIKHDEEIVWGKQGDGSGAVEAVFQETVHINGKGEIVEALPKAPADDSVWAVRSYNTDDAGVIFVNGVMVGGSLYKQDSDWININGSLLPVQDNIVAFASYNGASGGDWGFAIRRDDIVVWGSEGIIKDDWTLSYVQQVAIHADGSVEALAPDVSARMPPAGEWYVRAQSVQDLGGVLVNGQPVIVNWSNHGSDWVEITGLLYSDRDNEVTFAAWNFDGVYSWDFGIKHDEEILWAVSNEGSGQAGVVLYQDVVITGDGEIQQ